MSSGSQQQRRRRRKCRYCKALFRPDPRNASRQKACSKECCRKARKRESQQAWLAKPQNREYFRGPANVQRVQQWRREHPDYARRQPPSTPSSSLQDTIKPQAVDNQPLKPSLGNLALQDALSAQVPLLLGLIAHLTGSTLQDDIVPTLRRMIDQGSAILGPQGSESTPLNRDSNAYEKQTLTPTSTGSPTPPAMELDRPPLGL